MRGAAGGCVPVANRGMITASIMLANIMQGVDNTIAGNVALAALDPGQPCRPLQDQDRLGADFLHRVTAAIMMPLTGWLRRPVRHQIHFSRLRRRVHRDRLGALRRRRYRASASWCSAVRCRGFAVAPASFRLSQATLLQINPPERHGLMRWRCSAPGRPWARSWDRCWAAAG